MIMENILYIGYEEKIIYFIESLTYCKKKLIKKVRKILYKII